jgi:hypothetical protein
LINRVTFATVLAVSGSGSSCCSDIRGRSGDIAESHARCRSEYCHRVAMPEQENCPVPRCQTANRLLSDAIVQIMKPLDVYTKFGMVQKSRILVDNRRAESSPA